MTIHEWPADTVWCRHVLTASRPRALHALLAEFAYLQTRTVTRPAMDRTALVGDDAALPGESTVRR